MSISRDRFGTRIFFYIVLTFFPYVFSLHPDLFDMVMEGPFLGGHVLPIIETLVTQVFPLEWFWRQNRKPERERNHAISTPKPTIRLLGYLFIAVIVAYDLLEQIVFFMTAMATIVLTTEVVIILREKLNRSGFLSQLLIVVLISFNLTIYGLLVTMISALILTPTQIILILFPTSFILILVISELVQRYWIMAARRFGDQLS